MDIAVANTPGFTGRRSQSSRPLQAGLAALFLLALLLAFTAPIKTTIVQGVGGALEMLVPRAKLTHDAPVAGFIVLGGNVSRTDAAIDLMKRYPKAKLILSGPGAGEIAEARAAVDPRDLVIDRRAKTTQQNAWYTRDLITPKPGERWILVTSALHMPRALASFNAVGFPVQPWPVYDTSPARPASAEAIEHEVLGMLYYVLRGWAWPA